MLYGYVCTSEWLEQWVLNREASAEVAWSRDQEEERVLRSLKDKASLAREFITVSTFAWLDFFKLDEEQHGVLFHFGSNRDEESIKRAMGQPEGVKAMKKLLGIDEDPRWYQSSYGL